MPYYDTGNEQQWWEQSPGDTARVKHIGLASFGKHAFQIDQVLTQHSDCPTDFKKHREHGWPRDGKRCQQGQDLQKRQPDRLDAVGGVFAAAVA